jgi:two-component system LytT family sensor kinase
MNRPFPAPAAPAMRAPGAAAPAASAPGQDFSQRRDRLAALSIAAFWTGYFLIASAKAAIGEMPGQGEMAVRRLCVTMLAMGLTWALYMLLRRFEDWPTRRLIGLAFGASVPLALAYASVNWAAFHYFPIESHASLVRDKEMGAIATIAWSAVDWYFFILCWAVLWVAITYAAKVREAERTAARYARLAQEAELKALRYQVNPHFLFNTLNSLSTLVMRGRRDEAEAMILNLSDFLRATLEDDPTADVPLREEVEMQMLYLDIETLRFPGRLKTRVDVPEALGKAPVPGLILQPIVENAVRYAVARSLAPVTITIRAQEYEGALVLEVEDDGPVSAAPASSGCGVGLENVRLRLAARFGPAARFEAGRRRPTGWRTRLVIPLAAAKAA